MCGILRHGNGHVKVSKASNPSRIDRIIIHTGQVQVDDQSFLEDTGLSVYE